MYMYIYIYATFSLSLSVSLCIYISVYICECCVRRRFSRRYYSLVNLVLNTTCIYVFWGGREEKGAREGPHLLLIQYIIYY
jgi:hypothetical protein